MSLPRRLSAIASRVNRNWSISAVSTQNGIHKFTIRETLPVVEMELNEGLSDEEIEGLFWGAKDLVEEIEGSGDEDEVMVN